MKSKGSKEFSLIGKTGAELARTLGVTPAAVSRWKAGLNTPSRPVRVKIKALGGPDPGDWDDLDKPLATTPKKAAAKRTSKATPDVVVAEADRWLHELQDLRDEIQNKVTDIDGRARLLANAVRILGQLGKLTGVGLTVSVRQILDSPNWKLIEAAIVKALEPWPDAMHALARALDETRAG